MTTQEETGRKQLNAILEHPTYKQILKDSFGGIMYDLSKKNSYNTDKLLKLWEDLPNAWKEGSGGITQGVFNFLLND
jgi:hypothetical protein